MSGEGRRRSRAASVSCAPDWSRDFTFVGIKGDGKSVAWWGSCAGAVAEEEDGEDDEREDG